MARSSFVVACMTVALLFTWASANTLWMPVQVVDCDNRPVTKVKIALWGCVDAQGSSDVATLSTSSVVSDVDKDGYATGVMPPPAGGCPGLSAHFCYGSANNACQITVLNSDLTPNGDYDTKSLFDDYSVGIKEYVTSYVPQCKAKSYGAVDKCNNCGADQYCYSFTTILRPKSCPRACLCVA